MTTYTAPPHIILSPDEFIQFSTSDIKLICNKQYITTVNCLLVTNKSIIFTNTSNNDHNINIAFHSITEQKQNIANPQQPTIKQLISATGSQLYIITYTNRLLAEQHRQIVKLILIEVINRNKSRGLTHAAISSAPSAGTSTDTIIPSSNNDIIPVKAEPGTIVNVAINNNNNNSSSNTSSHTPSKRSADTIESSKPINNKNNNIKPSNTANKQSIHDSNSNNKSNNNTISSSPQPITTGQLFDLTDPTESSVLYARVELLRADGELRSLHQQLVKSGIISENEFWSSRQAEINNQQNRIQAQDKGVSSSSSNANNNNDQSSNTNKSNTTRRIRLDKSTIHNIFMTQPSVYRAYQDQVPLHMSEIEFWTRYYKLQQLRSAKQSAVLGHTQALRPDIDQSDELLFSRYEQETKQHNESIDDTHRTKLNKFIDPSIDLTSADMIDSMRYTENNEIDADTVIEDQTNKTVNKMVHNKRINESHDIIKHYNQHSNLVVETAHLHEHTIPNVTNTNHNNRTDANPPINVSNVANIHTIQQQQYHRQLVDSLRFTDLQHDTQPDYNTLSIQQSYYNNTNGDMLSDKQIQQLHSAEQNLFVQIQTWNVDNNNNNKHPSDNHTSDANNTFTQSGGALCSLPDSTSCYSILSDLSYHNRALNNASVINRNTQLIQQQHSTQQQAIQIYSTNDDTTITIPIQFQHELRDMYRKLCELLRHYWNCFPVAPHNRDQMEKLKFALDEHHNYINTYRTKLYTQNQATLVQLIKPLLDSLNKSDDAYTEFQRKESELKLRAQQAQAAKLRQQQSGTQT